MKQRVELKWIDSLGASVASLRGVRILHCNSNSYTTYVVSRLSLWSLSILVILLVLASDCRLIKCCHAFSAHRFIARWG